MESLVVLQIIHSSFVGLANLDILEAWVCIFSPLCCSGFVKERWENLDTALNTFLRAVIQTTVLLLFLFWNRIGIFLFLLLLKGLLFLFWIVLKSHPLKSHPTQSFAVYCPCIVVHPVPLKSFASQRVGLCPSYGGRAPSSGQPGNGSLPTSTAPSRQVFFRL